MVKPGDKITIIVAPLTQRRARRAAQANHLAGRPRVRERGAGRAPAHSITAAERCKRRNRSCARAGRHCSLCAPRLPWRSNPTSAARAKRSLAWRTSAARGSATRRRAMRTRRRRAAHPVRAAGSDRRSVARRRRFRPEFAAAYEADVKMRQEAERRGEPIASANAQCLPEGMPAMMIALFPMEVLQTRGQIHDRAGGVQPDPAHLHRRGRARDRGCGAHVLRTLGRQMGRHAE